MPAGPLCHACRGLCHAPTTPHPGPLPQGEREEDAPLSCPPAPLCHARGPPLSCPPVVSGNPASCFVVPLFVWACMGEAMDSRLKMSGMTEGGLNMSGMTEGLLCPLCRTCSGPLSFPPVLSVMPAGSPLSCPPVSPITNVGDKVSGNPVSCFFVLLFVWPLHGRSHGFPITNVGNDRRRIEGVGHDGRGD